MWAFLQLIPLRDWFYLSVALALGIGLVWFGEHERAVERDQIEAKLAQAQQQAQATIDAKAEEQNARIEARFNAHDWKPIDYSLPADCRQVPDEVRNAVNAAHHK